ncbi:MAG: hypothetical protein AAGI38_22080 [Bacteroidota bacterium]
MKSSLFLLVFISLHLVGCHHFFLKQDEDREFHFPEVLVPTFHDSLPSLLFKANHIEGGYPVFAGKYSFCDTVQLDPYARWSPSSEKEDFFWSSPYTSLEDSIDTNGFEVYVDYQTSVSLKSDYYPTDQFYSHFPVYLVNSTPSDKYFVMQSDYVVGLQETLSGSEGPYYNELPQWRPIEGKGPSFCNSEPWGLVVHPGQFVLILMKKYAGDYEANLRVRLKVGANIYTSRPFVGVIQTKQYCISEETKFYHCLKKWGGADANRLFYGALSEYVYWQELID